MNRAAAMLFAAACGGAPQPSGPVAATPSATNASTSPSTRETKIEMKAVTPTAYADDLRAAGLDPLKLPQLNKLPPEQLRKVMPLVAKSLGVKCNACHDLNAGISTKTPRMKLAEHMWNDFVRIRTSSDQAVFCDSCHHGSLVILDRSDRPALEKWMQSNFVETLGAGACKTCHGDPPRWRFLEGWKK